MRIYRTTMHGKVKRVAEMRLSDGETYSVSDYVSSSSFSFFRRCAKLSFERAEAALKAS